jgi:tetratricopeptide (TPR) repeat protein
MDDQHVEAIQKELDLRETEDLVEIWKEHDLSKWTEVAFEAIRKILLGRLGELPFFENLEEAKTYVNQAEDLLEAEKNYQALDKIDLAIQLAPHYGYAYYIKALIFDELENLEEAIKLYEKALLFSPNLKDARTALSWALDDNSRKNTHPQERILAALAHGGIILSITGLLVPAFIWITEREKSNYVAFQSLQALVFQVMVTALQISAGIFTFGIFVATTLAKPPGSIFWVYPLTGGLIFLFQVIIWLFGLKAIISTLQGKQFTYNWEIRKITYKLMLP